MLVCKIEFYRKMNCLEPYKTMYQKQTFLWSKNSSRLLRSGLFTKLFESCDLKKLNYLKIKQYNIVLYYY